MIFHLFQNSNREGKGILSIFDEIHDHDSLIKDVCNDIKISFYGLILNSSRRFTQCLKYFSLKNCLLKSCIIFVGPAQSGFVNKQKIAFLMAIGSEKIIEF